MLAQRFPRGTPRGLTNHTEKDLGKNVSVRDVTMPSLVC